MNDQQFDRLTRRLAGAQQHRATRRGVIRALGASGLSVVLAAGHVARSGPAVAQETPAPQPGVRPPGGPSVAQKAWDLQYDLEAIFDFVANEVRYDPYPGALRGAKGTLWGLAGNSVDQAMLLAALLNESLVTTRFAFGRLDEAKAQLLLESAKQDTAAAAEHARAVNALLSPAQGAPIAPPLSAEEQRLLDDLPTRSESILKTARAQIDSTLDILNSALTYENVTLPDTILALPDRERSDHVWVQYAAGGEWVDLDPAAPNAGPGIAYATATTTSDELPDDLFHSISFRLSAENVRGNTTERVDLLTYRSRSADLVDRPLSLVHVKPESLRALGESLNGTLEGTMQYIPHLAVSSDDTIVGVDRVTLGVGDGLISVLGGENGNVGDTIAEWLEVTITSPDSPPRHSNRLVFDRLSPEDRAAGNVDVANIKPAQLTEFGGSQLFLPAEAIWSIVTATGPIPFSYFQQDRSIDDFEADLGSIGFAYHHARDVLALTLAGDDDARQFLDAPNLTAFSITPIAISADAGRARVEIDLLHQSIGVVPAAGPEIRANSRLHAGVLSHVTERLATERLPFEYPEVPLINTVGVGRIFEAAVGSGVEIVVLRPDSVSSPRLDVSDRAQILIDEAISSGYLVVIPRTTMEVNGERLVGWWQIDPATGITFDRLETGKGVSGADYALMLKTIIRNAIYYGKLGLCVNAVYLMFALTGLTVGYAGATAATSGGGVSAGQVAVGGALGGATAGSIGGVALACS